MRKKLSLIGLLRSLLIIETIAGLAILVTVAGHIPKMVVLYMALIGITALLVEVYPVVFCGTKRED